MPKLIDIAGHKYGRLTVLKRAPHRGRYTMWRCQCDCGAKIITGTNSLRTGNTNSCGCYKADRIRETHQKTDHDFWDLVEVTNINECWPWKGALNNSGYGSFRGQGAHRYAYMVWHGYIPKDLHVLHTCDNRKCCNERHLFVGTVSDNWRDALRKGRTFYQKHPEAYPRGPDHSNAKLTAAQVRRIRYLYENTALSQTALAKRYNVTQACISLITRGVTYKCVQ
jgi:hypothetical protein